MKKFHPDRKWKAETKYDGVKCAVEGCNKPAKAKDYCHRHYSNYLRTGDPLGMTPRYGPICTIDECHEPTFMKGFCRLHYTRYNIYGDPCHLPAPSNRKQLTRNKALEVLYDLGFTLDSVGKLFEISRERVRQIVEAERAKSSHRPTTPGA